MTDQLDNFVNEMQTQIDTDALKTYGQAAFDRWKSPRCMYEIQNPDGHGRVSGECGDTIQIFLKFNSSGRVNEASFITDGCGPSGICGSFAVETAPSWNWPAAYLRIWAKARTISLISRVTPSWNWPAAYLRMTDTALFCLLRPCRRPWMII